MKKVLCVLTFIPLLVLGATLVRPTVAAAVTSPVVLDSLTPPANVRPAQSVTASARLHSASGTIAAQAVTVAVRSADGTAYDFPGATAASIPPSGYTFTSGARSFNAGTYQVFAAVLINGTWTNLSPSQTFTVTAAAPVAVDSLTVPATAVPNQAITAGARVHSTSGTVTVQAITVAVRSADGTAYDFPGATAATISPSGYTYSSGARAFTAGTYQAFVAVLIGGTWTNLAPSRTITVEADNPLTFSQDFNGPAGASANAGTTPTWYTDPCWSNNPACTGSVAQYKDDHARLDGQGGAGPDRGP